MGVYSKRRRGILKKKKGGILKNQNIIIQVLIIQLIIIYLLHFVQKIYCAKRKKMKISKKIFFLSMAKR